MFSVSTHLSLSVLVMLVYVSAVRDVRRTRGCGSLCCHSALSVPPSRVSDAGRVVNVYPEMHRDDYKQSLSSTFIYLFISTNSHEKQ